MKKLILLTAFAMMIFSCKPKEVVTSTKKDSRAQVAIKGNWVISSVSYPGSEYIKVTSFEIADSHCFE
ncbi:MAG TPA: hypothetical protein VK476_03785, partial [Flavobacterium sp.]|nr:hypothetical protein [Flavobacterium sp.]